MNSYIEEFLRHWKDVSVSIESSVITQIWETGGVSADLLNNIIERETSAWKNTFESKGKFIAKLAESNSKAAGEFKDLIFSFRLVPIKPPAKSSSVPSLMASVTAGVGVFALVRFAFHMDTWVSVVGGAAVLAAVSVFMGRGAKDKYLKSVKEAYSEYNKQVELRRDELLAVLRKLN